MPFGHSSPEMPSPQNHYNRHRFQVLPLILAGTLTLTLALLVFFTLLLYRKLYRNRTAPSDLISRSPGLHQCRRYSYSQLRRATNSFSDSNQLGHGGFGSVYKAVLPADTAVAVKVMDASAGSLQGEREFHNELALSSHLIGSPYVVSLLGFSSDRRGRRLILVYELMANRSFQDALLDRKCEELTDWNKRFEIATDIAKGIEFLHHCCDPPIIHGDIKPSNILLDSDFKAKIGDFGLARLKSEDIADNNDSNILIEEEEKRGDGTEDNESILQETDSLVTGYEEGSVVVNVLDQSPENCAISLLDAGASPEAASGLSPEVGLEKGSVSESCFEKVSVDSSKDLVLNNYGGKQKVVPKRDWWWKQDINGANASESGRVKDYVMEWIGSEIKKERPNIEWIETGDGSISRIERKKERIKRKEKNRKPREWWKEEFCEELTRKKKTKKKKRGLSSISSVDSWFHKDEESSVQEHSPKRKKKRNSIDWWLDGFSGELRTVMGRRNSQDSGLWCDINIPKSGGVSSTPSMRGTVCYIAPEYGGGGVLSEKCDVYSFGVLLLVLVSGRRPLQVTASPMAEFERANLISWARQLACNGKLLELVDKSMHSLDKDQAILCITIALLCLQRSPAKRPTMKEIVEMLSGAAELPHLPFEFSPSPPMGFPFKSRKKTR